MSRKTMMPIFHREDIFLKKSFISGLMIVALFSLAVSTFALFTCVFTQPVYEVLPP